MLLTKGITNLLVRWSEGDDAALEKLTPYVYDELRRLAQSYLRNERPDHTLQATALVHEAYLQLLGMQQIEWKDRGQFIALAAQMMRRILVDHARKHAAQKRGGGEYKVSLSIAQAISSERDVNLVALDEALQRLSEIDPKRSQIVELRFFGGLSIEETADLLKVSTPTIERDWRVARAFLRRELSNS
jgi:RNA polymerase sigma factor (TIGR02999 family)